MEVVPGSVIKQIKVWEKSYKSFSFEDVKLIMIASKQTYDNVKKEAIAKDGLIYTDGISDIVVRTEAWEKSISKYI